MNKAVFLDKDGTLVKDVPHNSDPDKVELYSDSLQALRTLQRAGYLLVIVSNQPGVALGYFEEEALHDVERRLDELFSREGVKLAGFFYCPHHPEGRIEGYAISCDCRKPKDGLIRYAANALEIEVSESWMIGDILHDVEAGNRAGCRTILVDRGNETEWQYGDYRQPDFMVTDLMEAVAHVLASVCIESPERGLL